MSKAQMEIFGLVIIVILLAIGLLFIVAILSKKPVIQQQTIKQSLEAANFLNSVLGTTVEDCERKTVRKLLQECAVASVENNQWVGVNQCDDGTNSCVKMQNFVDLMLNETLRKWGEDYRFFINGTESVELVHIERGNCTGEREGSTRPEKIQTGLDVNVTLQICRH